MHLCFELRYRSITSSLSYFSWALVQAKKGTCASVSVFQSPPMALYLMEVPPGFSTTSNCGSFSGFGGFPCLVFTGLLVGFWEKLCQAVVASHYFTPFSFVVNILILCIFIFKLFKKSCLLGNRF